MPAITFFHNPMSRGQIARWALEEVGADYEVVPVDWQAKPQALMDANPMGKIPTIIHHAADGDHVVSESAAICHYLAEIYPEAGLLPTDAEKADYFRWLFFAAGPIEHAVTSKAMGFAPTAEQEGMAGFGNYDRAVDTLAWWLGQNDYVCGNRFTMADVYVGSTVDWGLAFKTMPERPEFVAYAERLRGRAAYRTGKKMDDIGAPA
ncbi:glutathione S-transferase family protein [Croceicoccus bisphenolivorans]|uniref:glutathione S-transferase family protein n=1 Tax=Croceicoccus bisphenolivorans TaxID=1783232 RepID=UPI00083323FD|nr:glutathione S-transferase family protein [Croceicoccus bisphenolivorans]